MVIDIKISDVEFTKHGEAEEDGFTLSFWVKPASDKYKITFDKTTNDIDCGSESTIEGILGGEFTFPRVATDEDAERVWEDFWEPLVSVDGVYGLADLEKIKRELYDYRMVMQEVSKVYYEISNGKLSKPNTDAIHIIQEHHDRIDETVKEALAEVDEEQEIEQNAVIVNEQMISNIASRFYSVLMYSLDSKSTGYHGNEDKAGFRGMIKQELGLIPNKKTKCSYLCASIDYVCPYCHDIDKCDDGIITIRKEEFQEAIKEVMFKEIGKCTHQPASVGYQCAICGEIVKGTYVSD